MSEAVEKVSMWLGFKMAVDLGCIEHELETDHIHLGCSGDPLMIMGS